MELNFFDYSDNKRYHSGPNVVEYEKNCKPQCDLILGPETMKELGIMLDFKAKTITIDEVILSMRNINLLYSPSILHMLNLKNSLAMEPKSILDTTKHLTWILDTMYNKVDLQPIIKDNCKHLSANKMV